MTGGPASGTRGSALEAGGPAFRTDGPALGAGGSALAAYVIIKK
ncbi:hypothetical protein JOC34_003841 [Virgibacillus halotolerans]|nr:hypothetical protein [Virgibacillus halotolerans]MBM7601416.1 hypothetical protein [Virgibacillus halotolerans]